MTEKEEETIGKALLRTVHGADFKKSREPERSMVTESQIQSPDQVCPPRPTASAISAAPTEEGSKAEPRTKKAGRSDAPCRTEH